MEERLRKITAEESYRKGLRAALEAVQETFRERKTGSLDYAAGLTAAEEVIERLLEETKGDEDAS